MTKAAEGLLTGFFLTICFCSLEAQISTRDSYWRSFSSFKNPSSIIAIKESIVFVSTKGGFYSINLETGLTKTFSKSEGLTNFNLTCISYDAKNHSLWLGNQEGGISKFDLFQETFEHFSDIHQFNEPINKKINDIFILNERLLISTDFGIIDFSTKTKKITQAFIQLGRTSDRYKSVQSVLEWQGKFIAVLDSSLALIDSSEKNLIDPEAWQTIAFNEKINASTLWKNSLYLGTSKRLLHINNPQTLTLNDIPELRNRPILGLSSTNNTMAATYRDTLILFLQNNTLSYAHTRIKEGNYTCMIDDQTVAILTDTGSIAIAKNSKVEILNPLTKSLFEGSLSAVGIASNKQVWVSGETTYSSVLNSETENWQKSEILFHKMITIKKNRSYLATKKSGLFDISSNTFLGAGMTSSDGTLFPSQINDIEQDINGLLYFVSEKYLKVFILDLENEKFESIDIRNISALNAPKSLTLDDLSRKWLTIWEGNQKGKGIAILNDNTTPYNEADDSWLFLNENSGFGSLPSNNVTDIAKDQFGTIWITTSKGVAYYLDPDSDVSHNDIKDIQVVSELAGREFTSVTVDGSGRKWLTSTEGVWVIESGSDKIITHFNKANSLLLSNDVRAISFASYEGNAFCATSKGLSILTDPLTSSPKTIIDKLEIFPNPFLIPFHSALSIRGLSKNATVKILNSGGEHIKELIRTTSGGASWDGTDEHNQLVSSGIYIIIAKSQDSRNVVMGKVAMIRKH